MRSIKRNLFDLSILGAMALALALAWGSPFVSAGAAHAQDQAQPQQQQQNQSQAKSATFTGTIVRNGAQYALRDSSGAVYTLDDPERAKPFEGKTVKVTGQLDEQAKVIHVESIEGAEA
jgi:long-subunit fatty acid transport protein